MEIEYIFRPPSKMVSIEKCFENIISNVSNEVDITSYVSYVRKFSFWPLTVLYNVIRYAFKSYRNRIFHITGDIQYVGILMRSAKTVMTVHDCVVLHDNNVNQFFKKIVYYLWYYLPLKHLKYICCISEETKRDLLSFFPWAESKIYVIPSPVSDAYHYCEKAFNDKCPRILHVGTRDNKNLPRVIKALDGYPCHLRIIGELSKEQKELLMGSRINYSNATNIPEEQMYQEYCKADIVSFPSLFEGFGLPIVEAQVVGRPIVTSLLEPMKTIGKGAILVDPFSVASIRKGFLAIIEDRDLREQSIKRGLQNCKEYKAKEVAALYIKLYKQIYRPRKMQFAQ